MADGMDGLRESLARSVADVFPTAEPSLAARLAEAEQQGRPLRIKLGIDPTLIANRAQLAQIARGPDQLDAVLQRWQADLLRDLPSLQP